MSKEVLQACPRCSAVQPFRAWQTVNTRISPEAAAQVLDCSLFLFQCQKCGAQAQLLHPLLYHDMEKRLMIYLMPPGSEDSKATLEQMKGGAMAEFQLRIVESPEELAEKVRLFECGLDDRIVDLFKPTVMGDPERMAAMKVGPLVFHGSGPALPDGEATYGFHGMIMGQFAAMNVGARRYEEFREKAEIDLTPFESLRGEWLRIGSAPPIMPIPPNFNPEELAKRKHPAASNTPPPPAGGPFAQGIVPPANANAAGDALLMGRLMSMMFPVITFMTVVVPAWEKGEPLGIPLGVFGLILTSSLLGLWRSMKKKS